MPAQSGTTIRMNYGGSDVRPVSAAEDNRVPQVIERMTKIGKLVVAQLQRLGSVSVLGADCPVVFADESVKNVDVRLKHQRNYPYCEMKWSRASTDDAMRRAFEHREVLRRVVQEPARLCLPGCPESRVRSTQIAFLGVSPKSWRLVVEDVAGRVVVDKSGYFDMTSDFETPASDDAQPPLGSPGVQKKIYKSGAAKRKARAAAMRDSGAESDDIQDTAKQWKCIASKATRSRQNHKYSQTEKELQRMKIWNAAHNPIHNETHNAKWNGSSKKAEHRRSTRCEHCGGRHSSKRCPLARSVGGKKYYKKLLKELKNK